MLFGCKVIVEIVKIWGIFEGYDLISFNGYLEIKELVYLFDMILIVWEIIGKLIGFKVVIGEYIWFEILFSEINNWGIELVFDFIMIDSVDGGMGVVF